MENDFTLFGWLMFASLFGKQALRISLCFGGNIKENLI